MIQNSKVAFRLPPEFQEAIDQYMADNFLTNISEVYRSALGQFLGAKGYLEGYEPRTANTIPFRKALSASRESDGKSQKQRMSS